MEHPDITMALRTGYPKPYKENIVICTRCGREIRSKETVYAWGSDALCEECCRECIEDNYNLHEIAKALKIPMSYAGVK